MRELKTTDIEWLGDIPVNWDIHSLKRVLSNPITDGPHETPILYDEGIPFVSAESVKGGVINLNYKRGYISLEDHERFQRKVSPKKGDIFIVKSGATTGNVGLVITDQVFDIWSPLALVRGDSSIVEQEFLYYQLLSNLFRVQVEQGWSYGTQQNISMKALGNIKVLVPPLEEQKIIIKYLHNKCTQIDTIIAKEQSVIEKLQEYRQSIITETVTRGLDSTVNMIPSGVEWINSIPLNWKIIRLTKSFEFFKGLNIKKTDLVDSGAGVVSYGQVHAKNNNGYSLQDDLIRYVAEDLIDEKSLLQEGDFVFADTSEDLEGVGNCIHIDSSNELYAGYHTLVARCSDESICTKYLAFLFLTDIWRSQLRKNANGTKVYSITQKMFKAVSCLVPPIEEQLKIVAYLEQKCDFIDKVISHKLTIIDTLIEYKKSLIYEVVTGKKEIPHV